MRHGLARGLASHAERRAGYFTLHKVRVVRLVGREHRRHLVVVGWVDVLINAIASQLYL